MINDIRMPDSMGAAELDKYLEMGWFRMGQTIFTTDRIPLGGVIYPVYWLRIELGAICYGRAQQKLLAANRRFEVQEGPFLLNAETEKLFEKYKNAVDFIPPDSILDYLYLGANYNIYDTRSIEVRENGRLIACGIFDQGRNSIAGILNFYDPDYKKHSLGKWLMLLKINHAQKSNLLWYYPGYLALGTTKFDYKLFPDRSASEYLDRNTGGWRKIDPFFKELTGQDDLF